MLTKLSTFVFLLFVLLYEYCGKIILFSECSITKKAKLSFDYYVFIRFGFGLFADCVFVIYVSEQPVWTEGHSCGH